MKKVLSLLLVFTFVFATGCATIEKYAQKGLEEGKKALDREANKFVDKEAGEGSYADYNEMKGDKTKLDMVYPYLVKLNKQCSDKKITKEERDEKKAKVKAYYKDFTDGKIDAEAYNKKCTELVVQEQEKSTK